MCEAGVPDRADGVPPDRVPPPSSVGLAGGRTLIGLDSMGLFRRRRGLDLRPLSELHDEFMKRPNAEELLAEADDYLTQRENEQVLRAE